MMDNQNHDFHQDNTDITSPNPINNQEAATPMQAQPGQTYRYVFSATDQAPQPQKPEPKRNDTLKRILFSVITIILSASIALFAGFAGALLANSINQEENPDTHDAHDSSQLYQENAETILSKDETENSIYGSAGEDVFTVSQVVQQVQDSVVVIDVQVLVSSFYGSYLSSSSGSGVIVSAEGYILTCNHVVESAKEITVTLTSGSKYKASLVGTDPENDLAVLRIQPKDTEPLTYAKQGCSGKLVVGEKVVAIGNPLGSLGGTVTDGIISATDRLVTTSDNQQMTLLQTNAAINQGNSGGGLFNMDGQLIGIVNAKYAATGVEGLAFAIPIDLAYEVELDLIEHGYIRGIVDHGLETLDVTEKDKNYYYKKFKIEKTGVYIVSAKYDSDALRNMDRIVSVNGTAIATTEELNAIVDQLKVGDTVKLEIERDGETFEYSMTLREYVPDHIEQEN